MSTQDKAQYNPELTLGLIAGGGDMPFRVKEAVQAQDGRIHILGIKGSVDAALGSVEQYPMAHLGKFIKALKKSWLPASCVDWQSATPELTHLAPRYGGHESNCTGIG